MLKNVRFSALSVDRFLFGLPRRTHVGCYIGHSLDYALEESGYEIKRYVYEGKTLNSHEDWIEMNKEFAYFGSEQFITADSLEQVIKHFKRPVLDPDKMFVIEYGELNREDHGGFRWHKNGRYIGIHEPRMECLGDEPIIERIVCAHIYELLEEPTILDHIKNYLRYPYIYLKYWSRLRK